MPWVGLAFARDYHLDGPGRVFQRRGMQGAPPTPAASSCTCGNLCTSWGAAAAQSCTPGPLMHGAPAGMCAVRPARTRHLGHLPCVRLL